MVLKQPLSSILLLLALMAGSGPSYALDEKLILSKLNYSAQLEQLKTSLEDLDREKDEGADKARQKQIRDQQKKIKNQLAEEKKRMHATTAKCKDLLHRVASGGDINMTDNEGCTLIMRAAQCGNDDVVKIILKENPRLDLQDNAGRTALSMERSAGGSTISNILTEQWEEAVANADTTLVKKLLASGVSPSRLVKGNPPLGIFIKSGQNDMVNAILACGPRLNAVMADGTPLLELAIKKKNAAAIKALMQANMNPNTPFRNNMHPLNYLLIAGTPETVCAYIKGSGSKVGRLGMGGISILNLCVRTSPKEIINAVADEMKSYIDREDDMGNLPVLEAARRGYPEVYDLIVGKGAKADATNSAGETVLMHAVLSNRPGMVQHVLQTYPKEKIALKDKAGHDAMYYAQQVKNAEIQKLLSK